MIGTCVHSTGASLGVPARGSFYTARTEFDLRVGSTYPIVGMGIFETVLLVLVADESGRPNWLPVGLFEFDSRALPSDWEFAVLDGLAASGGDASNRWVARWGYPELVRDTGHSDALIEREPEALAVFARELSRRLGERA